MKKLERLFLGNLKVKVEKGKKEIKDKNKKLCKQIYELLCPCGNIDNEMLGSIDEQLSNIANKDHSLKEII